MKPYKTNEQLIEHLINNKKINGSTIPNDIFKNRAYTSIINPYKNLVCINQDPNSKKYIYKENGDFEEYLQLARLDDFLSNRFNMYIETFEKQFKSYVGEVLADKLKTRSEYCNNYEDIINFCNMIPSRNDIINFRSNVLRNSCYHQHCFNFLYFDKMYDSELRIINAKNNIILNRRRALDNLLKEANININSNNILIKHYKNNREKPPVWVVVHALSFGDILALFNMFHYSDREKFIKYILGRNSIRFREISKFSRDINKMRLIRNTINHYEPLIPFLLKMYSDESGDYVLELIKLLKDNYRNKSINSLNVIRKFKNKSLQKNDFNKNNIEFLNKLSRNI